MVSRNYRKGMQFTDTIAAKTIEKENLKLITVSENLTDDHYRIEIRLSTN